MTPAEVEKVIRVLSGAWGYFAHDDAERIALWSEHLDRMDFEPARKAARKLTETCDQLPSLATFLRAARDEARFARMASQAPTTDRPPCGLCDGTGWARAAVAGDGVFAVVACRCSAGPAHDGRDHPPACSCRRCHYGERRAADIANGADGLARSGLDPLARRGAG